MCVCIYIFVAVIPQHEQGIYSIFTMKIKIINKKLKQNKTIQAQPECCAFSSCLPGFDLFAWLYLVFDVNPGSSLINAHSEQNKEHRRAGSYSEELQVLGWCTGGASAFNSSLGLCLLSACPRSRQLCFPMAWWTGWCTWGHGQGASITHLWQ